MHALVNSQAVQWYFCTTEGVFRLLSEEDILKLSIHPPYPHLKFHGGSFRATFEYRGVGKAVQRAVCDWTIFEKLLDGLPDYQK